MVNYKIIPYDKSHSDEILTFGMNDKLLEDDASCEEGRIDYGIPGLSFSLFANNDIVLSGGITPMWDGVAEGWVIASKRIFDHKIKSIISIKKRLDLLCENNNVWRLQTSVKENFKTGIRFAEFLGLKKEGLMRMYGPDKSNYYRMAKIYELHR
ncbi:putative acetyltransferase [uncultured Mediterranean phage uvMED]|jgi:hypothetical protein|nr:putative acetyltransferase [uncultured Mediterranean phage uvMED]